MFPPFVRKIVEADPATITESSNGAFAASLLWLQRELIGLSERATMLQCWEESLHAREQRMRRGEGTHNDASKPSPKLKNKPKPKPPRSKAKRRREGAPPPASPQVDAAE